MKTQYASRVLLLFFAGLLSTSANADWVLIGDNAPFANVNDGNFDLKTGWKVQQSPHWNVNQNLSKGKYLAGVAKGVFSTRGNDITVVESQPLVHHKYPLPKTGDTVLWRFVAKAEHRANAKASMSLIFSNGERQLIELATLNGGPDNASVFAGSYTFTEQDTSVPFVRFQLHSENKISILLQEVDVRVLNKKSTAPEGFNATATNNGFHLAWPKQQYQQFKLYKKSEHDSDYFLLSDKRTKHTFTDLNIVPGVHYQYLLAGITASGQSYSARIDDLIWRDNVPPKAPNFDQAEERDTEIVLTWKATDIDIKHYELYRGDKNAEHFHKIPSLINAQKFIDDYPSKRGLNSYKIRAVDFSGNKSEFSKVLYAQPKARFGASFSDLIQPIPIDQGLRADLWGAENVIPRNPNNGIEHPLWSYWGGNPTQDTDGLFHMLVVRWPENGPRGHWEWPESTVVHTTSEKPTGPYIPSGELAYSFAKGKGHNADVIKLNDGRYLLYSLVNWKPMLFTSKSLTGPWQLVGEMIIEYDAKKLGDTREYQVQRNLSGVQLNNGDMLFVTKFGRMIKSKNGLLGPYKVLSDTINNNPTIPARYRKSNYEDPVMWKDDLQYHQIINAFLDYRAIYLRSKDGITWKYDTGLAYTPESTEYQNGIRTYWYKLERPHVLQDQYGRATHLSLAAIDVPKKYDFANDKHSAKNIIIPLTKHTLIELVASTKAANTIVKILIKSEADFNAQTDIQLSSLRFGASEAVNFGRGSVAIEATNSDNDLLVSFDCSNCEFTEANFVGKLLGTLKNDTLLVGFSHKPSLSSLNAKQLKP